MKMGPFRGHAGRRAKELLLLHVAHVMDLGQVAAAVHDESPSSSRAGRAGVQRVRMIDRPCGYCVGIDKICSSRYYIYLLLPAIIP